MKIYLTTLILFFSFAATSFSSVAQAALSFQQVYPKDYASGLSWVKAQQALLKKKLGKNAARLVSVVFPEVARYSIWRDYAETNALERLYVTYGATYADFSIGYCQMKPSWVEQLEQLIQQYQLSSFQQLIVFSSTTPSLIRKERIERLSNLQWQLAYLAAFYEVAKIMYKLPQPSVGFLAALYNRGFAEKKTIEYWQSVKAFPWGSQSRKLQFSYAAVATAFYQEEAKNLF
ncbi:MAG: hypothetical protein ACFB0B_20600 [Thermonemataceae bacterium]